MDEIVEFVDEVAGIYFRSILINAGVVVPQHVHDYDHATYCGRGRAAMYVNGEFVMEVVEGRAVSIEAGKHHEFLALEDNTRLTCVHDARSAAMVKEKGL